LALPHALTAPRNSLGGIAPELFGVGGDRLEIASKKFEGVFFPINFAARADPEPPQYRDRRAPSLDGVLQQKTEHSGGKEKPFAVGEDAQQHAAEGQAGGIGFEPALNVPFLLQFLDPGER